MRPKSPSPYSHRFHAGNVGDVWKHCALIELLLHAVEQDGPLAYVESHAGEGEYALGLTGEWTEGVGRLWQRFSAEAAVPVRPYLRMLRALGQVERGQPIRYPGSPLVARAFLEEEDRAELWELDPEARSALARRLGDDPRFAVHEGDGLAALPEAVTRAETGARSVVVLVDPPYRDKAEWLAVGRALAAAYRASTRAAFLLWYPVKSLTRPNALLAQLAADGVSGAAVELVTTPLEHQRHRLNGSGMVFLRPPDGVVSHVLAAVEALGHACATHGRWSARALSFGAPSAR